MEILQTNWAQTEERGRLTVLIGRRRIGKTTLLGKSAENGRDDTLLYLYVSKDNERVLTGKFQEAAEHALGLQIFGRMETFAQFFESDALWPAAPLHVGVRRVPEFHQGQPRHPQPYAGYLGPLPREGAGQYGGLRQHL